MNDKEKIQKAIELLKSCSPEAHDIATIKTYYHEFYLLDIIENLQEVHLDNKIAQNYGY